MLKVNVEFEKVKIVFMNVKHLGRLNRDIVLDSNIWNVAP